MAFGERATLPAPPPRGLPVRRSLLGMVIAAVQARARVKGRRSRLAAAAVKAREHLVTAAALASIDLGCFRASPVAGFIVLGASLAALDWAVTGR